MSGENRALVPVKPTALDYGTKRNVHHRDTSAGLRSSEIVQLLISQLSETLANTLYIVRETGGILERFFVFPFSSRTVVGGMSLTRVLSVC